MHPYDVPRRQSFQPIHVPSARSLPEREMSASWSAQDFPGSLSATPIYDALYDEYVKSFRALPGDRSGEEDLGFIAFGNLPHRSSSPYGRHTPGASGNSYSAYSAGVHSARHGQQPHWQRMAHHALPPGPRRGV
ncbi:hypothetical protein GCM10010129_51870 [Streptomyces fumigatiscleroticus]|nr:hypothetical protein GCM10010129_51870 [Streptomyces fumigatiscleroticus]